MMGLFDSEMTNQGCDIWGNLCLENRKHRINKGLFFYDNSQTRSNKLMNKNHQLSSPVRLRIFSEG
ncbi:protein of unknown function [Vibrio tapetis subsp. tapetis]|uniref:Uncharacterized protein n=1 Tax=Vibrio tapetis subsp. tapetis TaxID=1671868 RepID=A0A2N8ZGK1_9VIBR|nr:protein of unknown function [Vibrio tapetis subsp. tapetis]